MEKSNYKEKILNQSAKNAIKDFISSLINDNQVPVYMVKNLLLEAVYNLNIKEQAEYEEAVKEYRKYLNWKIKYKPDYFERSR